MLACVAYRGDTSQIKASRAHGLLTLGLRTWAGRHDGELRIDAPHSAAIAGAMNSANPDLIAAFSTLAGRRDIDGNFAAAWIDRDSATLHLARDPFGVRSLYYFIDASAIYFATELKQLLALCEIKRSVDLVTIHKYLTFSFVPGEAVPVVGIKRVLAGHVVHFDATFIATSEAYFALEETEIATYRDRATAVATLREIAKAAVTRGIAHQQPVALYLSGGLDSAAMAVWLKSRGANTTLLTLDFGDKSAEREEARAVAATVGFRHEMVPMNGVELASRVPQLATMLDLPFGDAVTGPQMFLGLAAHKLGIHHVLNGEGGDQLFGGWTNKPMIAAEIFAGVVDEQVSSREETYLRSYHRFYGAEDALYTPAFRAAVGGPGQRRAHLAPYLAGERGESFLSRVRLADIALKGSQNILPRAERIAAGLGLSVAMPLFDRKLAEFSFHLPSELKLNGACEKYLLKLAMQGRLPEDIIWRKKSGMGVPMTDWLAGPMRDVLEHYVGDRAVLARGWFRKEYVAQLREGRDHPGETRRRRIGEKLWALVMLEAWMQHVVEGKS